MINIIESSADNQWLSILKRIGQYDFYHTPSYHQLDETGKSKLLVFIKENNIIVFPVVIRPIDGTQFFDLTSVYGYAGPLSNIPYINNEIIAEFQLALNEFFIENKIIAAFARLHPLFSENQEYILKGYGDILSLNKTVSIDLTQSIQEQRHKYDKSLKHKINQLRNNAVSVRFAVSDNDFNEFHKIYIETMERVSANNMYYFPYSYFKNLQKANDFDSFILLAIFNNEIIAGSFFTICCNIMQYHLSGTKNDFLKMGPMKLILDEARLIANSKNLDIFHLGGGVGGSNDSLFNFKAGFSDNYHLFKVWKKIVNEEIYDDLVAKKFGSKIPVSNFFPLYRF